MIVGGVAEPAVTGALQTLSSVPSPAVKCISSVKVSPAESVTLLAVALPELQIAGLDDQPISRERAGRQRDRTGRRRCPSVTGGGLDERRRAGAAVGVTALDGADAGLVPTALVAVTVNV